MMTLITRKLFTFLTCAALFICFGSASAQDMRNNYQEALSEAGKAAGWTTNEDGSFDDHAFYVVNYRIWDTNHDGSLSEDEWQSGMEHYATNQEENTAFTDWDTNQDGSIDVNEYEAVMRKKDVLGFNESMNAQNDSSHEQNTQDQNMQNATVMIWDEDDDPWIERIEYGGRSFQLDQDDN